MKRSVAIDIKDVYKEFTLPQHKNSSVKSAFVNIIKKNNKTVQRVLDGVSFDIKEGEFFGIVGRNGSGKSTLLKMIAGVYTPTSGTITLHGKLTPFIELGVGFNPELSGRDNVFLNGALLGFTRSEMEAMYDDIVAFAELEPFMDQKLKNYSSGMQVRLAFSIAIKARNDIMIFDEVLAVGDEAFQKKCLDVFDNYKLNKQTIVLVTHDMETVKRYCNRAALIHQGELKMVGDPVRVANEYSRLNQLAIDDYTEQKNAQREEKTKVNITTEITKQGEKVNSFRPGEMLDFSLTWDDAAAGDRLLIDIYRLDGVHVCNFISSREGIETLGDIRSVTLSIQLNLTPGTYFFSIGMWEKDFRSKLYGLSHDKEFTVIDNFSLVPHEFAGTTLLKSNWSSR